MQGQDLATTQSCGKKVLIIIHPDRVETDGDLTQLQQELVDSVDKAIKHLQGRTQVLKVLKAEAIETELRYNHYAVGDPPWKKGQDFGIKRREMNATNRHSKSPYSFNCKSNTQGNHRQRSFLAKQRMHP
jgi:hypothetical protein